MADEIYRNAIWSETVYTCIRWSILRLRLQEEIMNPRDGVVVHIIVHNIIELNA